MRRTALLVVALATTTTTGTAADSRGPIFAAPVRSRPGTLLPDSGPLAAPVITPAGTTHGGRQNFEMIPAGWEREPFFTRDPGRYATGACDTPAQCSSAGWVAFDFLLWATQGPGAPPLVTTGPVALGQGIAGVPGAHGTAALIGGSRVLNDVRPGFRLDFFLPVAADGRWGFGTRFETLGASADTVVAVGNGANVLNVPQAVNLPGVAVVTPLYVGFPGLTAGSVTASTHTDFFGADHHLRHVLAAGDAVRLDGIVGYRYLHVGDRIAESWDVFAAGNAPPGGPRLMGEESLRTRNDFHGGLLGLGSSARVGRFSVAGRLAVALGETVSERDQSHTRVVVPGVAAGGLAGLTPVTLVAAGGEDRTTHFAVAPDVSVKFGWQVVDHLNLTAGYSFVYLSHVRRAQDEFLPGAAPLDRTTDFWAQGLNLGVELRY